MVFYGHGDTLTEDEQEGQGGLISFTIGSHRGRAKKLRETFHRPAIRRERSPWDGYLCQHSVPIRPENPRQKGVAADREHCINPHYTCLPLASAKVDHFRFYSDPFWSFCLHSPGIATISRLPSCPPFINFNWIINW